MSSSPCRKRLKLSSPKGGTLDVVDISDGEDDSKVVQVKREPGLTQVFNRIPIVSSQEPISVEDISDGEGERPPPPPAGESPLKMLIRATMSQPSPNNIPVVEVQTPDSAGVNEESTVSFPKTIGSPRHMVQEISSTTTRLPATIGSPRHMVQEISSTVVINKQFLFTGLNAKRSEEKERIKIMIKQLGGQYIDTTSFVEAATHIVLGCPNTGEKYMGGLMTGKWLLKIEYVQDSHTSGRWLDEKDYEWSSKHLNRDEADPELVKLADAAQRCRVKYANGTGPFHDLTVSIQSNHPRRQECYERLFKAGGGRVVSDYQKSLSDLTMVLVDDPDRTVIPELLQNHSSPLIKIRYIHELVLEKEMPNLGQFVIKRKEAEQLPKVHWMCTYSTVTKNKNLAKRKCDRKIEEMNSVMMQPEKWRCMMLPLTCGQAPPIKSILYFTKNILLPSETLQEQRQLISDMTLISWYMPPVYLNRTFYCQILSVQEQDKNAASVTIQTHNADHFIALMDNAVTSPTAMTEWYFVFISNLLETDFYNWERQPIASEGQGQGKEYRPLVERLFYSWYRIKSVLRHFLRHYVTVMTSDVYSEEMKKAFSSVVTVYFTSNWLRKLMTDKDNPSTMEFISQTVVDVVMFTIQSGDTRKLHLLLHKVGHSAKLLVTVLNKVLLTLDSSNVPEHYIVLTNRPQSWEKFFNFYLYLRYTNEAHPAPLNTELYLTLLGSMFRGLSEDAKPPETLNPFDKITEFICSFSSSDLNRASSLILRILQKVACQTS